MSMLAVERKKSVQSRASTVETASCVISDSMDIISLVLFCFPPGFSVNGTFRPNEKQCDAYHAPPRVVDVDVGGKFAVVFSFHRYICVISSV
jgi:hypothetical protein